MKPSEELTIFDELVDLNRSDPFVPYTIVMVSGSRYHIRVTDIVVIGSSVTIIFRASGERHLLRASQVSEISVEENES